MDKDILMYYMNDSKRTSQSSIASCVSEMDRLYEEINHDLPEKLVSEWDMDRLCEELTHEFF